MAFTEASLNAAIDPTGTGKIINITRFLPDNNNPTVTVNVYATPINGYRGNSKFVALTFSNTAAQAAIQLQNALL